MPFNDLQQRLNRKAVTPKLVSDQQVPIVAFFLLAVIYAVVTFEKINLCVNAGMETC